MPSFPSAPGTPGSTMAAPKKAAVQFGKVSSSGGHRIVIYGPGGIGKTSLAAGAPGLCGFVDIEESLGRIISRLAVCELDKNIQPVNGVTDWASLRGVLQSDGWDPIKNIIIDSGTKAEEWAVAHTLRNTKTEKGNTTDSIEGYGYGKGYQHVYETFLPLLSDLDAHCRAGRNVIIICHDCTATVPNPSGEDWIRYEPRLQNPNSGKSSIRLRVREWADHMLFYGYDISVNKDGKGTGSGARTIYPVEQPHCMAKSRSTQDNIPVPAVPADRMDAWKDIADNVWSQIIK